MMSLKLNSGKSWINLRAFARNQTGCADMKAQSRPVTFQLQSDQKPSKSLTAANSNSRAGFIDERDLIIDSSDLSRSGQHDASLSLLMFFVIIVATIALLLELMPTAWDALEKLQVI